MKKLVLFLGVTLLAVNAFAQGTVSFANDNTTLVRFDAALPAVGGNAVPVQQIHVGLYAGPVGASFEQMTLVSSAVPILPLPGRFNGGVVTVPGVAGGGEVALQVRAWTGAAGSSYEAVFATGNADNYVGFSSIWTQITGNATPTDPAKSILPGFTGVMNVAPVPEPSMIAFGLLGGLALLLRFRRK
jgi:hypothetical protein